MIPLHRVVLVLMALLLPLAAEASLLPGDVNGDGRVDAGDVARLESHVTDGLVLSSDELDAADVAPLVGGVPAPDTEVGLEDLLVLVRAARGDIALPRTIAGSVASDQTWPAGSPYQITDDLTVEAGSTLTLESGAVLQFSSGAEPIIEGSLDVDGVDDTSRVQLTSDGSTSRTHWEGVRVVGGDATIDWALVEYARDGITIGSGATATVRNTTVREFRLSGITVGSGAAGATLEDNLLDNTAGPHQTSIGIALGRMVDPVLRNTVKGTNRGIQIIGFVEAQEVQDNTIELNNVGFWIEDAKPHLVANQIAQNTRGVLAKNAAPLVDGGNRFELNVIGFDSQYSTSGSVTPDPVVNGNEFIANGTHWVVGSRSDLVFDVTGNWWDSDQADVIESGIDDYSDNQNAAVVDFVPFLDAPLDMSPQAIGDDTYLVGYHTGTLAAQEWQMIGRVRVPATQMLTIPAGAILKVQPDLDLEVSGTLLVQGTSNDKVQFRSAEASPGPGDWRGILVSAGGTGTVVDHATILHARRGVEIHAADTVVQNTEIQTFSVAGILVASGSAATLTTNHIHDDDGSASGIRIEAASPHLVDNEIHAVDKGIEIIGASTATIDGENEVYGNVYGLWLEGDGSDLANNPSPVVNQNRIYGNGTANLHAEGYVRQGVVPVDARQNYWGTTVAADVLADLTTSDGLPAPVDVSSFLDASLQIVGPTTLFAFHLLSVDAWVDLSDPQNPNRDHMAPTEGQTLTVELALTQQADVTVDIYEELDDVRTTPVETLPIVAAGAGTHQVVWDGRDSAGDIVADEAYVYVVSVDDGLVQDSFDPARPEPKSDGSGDGVGKPGGPNPEPFNTFQNDFWQMAYLLENALGRIDTRAETRQGSSVLSQCDWYLDRPVYPALYEMVWDGRCVGGDLLRDDLGNLHEGNYHVYFGVPKPVRPNAVVVEKTTPRITGGPPNVEVRADPYFTIATYDQVSQIAYCLDRPAHVTVKVWAPPYSSGVLRATLLDNQLQPDSDCDGVGSPNVLEWAGQDPSDVGNPNNVAVADGEDVYTFTIEAADPGQPSLVTTYRGVLQTKP